MNLRVQVIVGSLLCLAGARAAAAARDLSPCERELAAHGVNFAPYPEPLPGLERPLVVSFPLAGLDFRYVEDALPQRDELMSCPLALAVAEAAPALVSHGVVEIVHIGAYKYRCPRGHGQPPNCRGAHLSEHATGMALDVAGLTAADGTFYSVARDWVRDKSRKTACSSEARRRRTQPADRFLHEVFCDLVARRTFSRYVSPNADRSHWNHVHLGLVPTDGKGFDWRRNLTGRL